MTRARRFSLFGGAAIALVALALGFAWRTDWRGGEGARSPMSVGAIPSAGPSKALAQPVIRPSFDAVHIGPDGQVVIAGRAAPGAEVTVLDHDRVVGKATADANGEWVFTPDQRLPPGTHELSLAARPPGGGDSAHSSATVAVLVPERPLVPTAGASGAVALLLPQSGAGAAVPVQMPGRAGRHITLDIVEYEAGGTVVLSGRSDPGARVGIFVNDRRLATAATEAAGRWSSQLTAGVPFGRYRLRLEAVSPAGARLDQLAVVLRRAAPGDLAPGDYIAVVPGNNLWHVAQQSYGDGVRYVEIYRANPQRIADPNLIYPGQFLSLPAKQSP